MIRRLLVFCLFAFLGVVPRSAHAATTPSPKHESPFACVESALSPAERKQHFEEYGPKLRARLERIHELPNGYEFAFAPDAETYRMLSTWMFQERLCCPFFDLDLRIDREGGPIWLGLTGRQGVKEFIAAEFDPWFQTGKAR
jgi:hypothetical protein